jgi:class 3 adenylate cyclase/tetratricopeptide (TPR) repeat protein
MRCAKCGSDNREGAKFCSACATAFSAKCPRCGSVNRPSAKFCDECATSLDAAPRAGATDPSPVARGPGSALHRTPEQQDASTTPDGERKTVTALFADIKGSTELMEDLDPEEARAIIDPALKLMIESVRRYDGYVVQSTGDGIFALFGAPVAHEDHPQRALYAALRMQTDLKVYSAKVLAAGGTPIQGRVGINTGEVVVRWIKTGLGQVEYTPIGHTTNLASRMQTAAPVGSIAVSENTRRLCEGYFNLKPLGATRVKGLSEPVHVYEVTGLGPLRTRLQRAAGRGLTKFVGRERELEALKHGAEQAKGGRGQIVAAIAEPGVGKSRLYFEFKATSQSGWMVLETVSISHGKASAYLPVLDLLHGYFKIASGDDERTRREKVAGRLSMLDPSLEDTRPYLFSLLGIVEGADPLAQMDGQLRKRRTLEAIKRILLRESLNQPLMVIFEDLHWIDEATQEFLNLLADSLGTAKLLLLVNYRPEYSHKWNSKTYYTQLRLDPLGKESAGEMLLALLGDGKDLIPLKQLIVDTTEGNPFFMEETVQVLFDEGALVRAGAAAKLTKPLNALKIPPTVQGILAARIDRLPAEAKELLQTLAVIGREFPLSLIGAVVTKSDDELNRLLNDLQMGEFIYEQPAVADTEYIFKHALTQEVAYNSLLAERRKLVHERAAMAAESLFATSLADHYDDLVHHYGRSGNAPKAVSYLRLAAQQAMNRSAFPEAEGQLAAALELLQTLPDDAERARTELALLVSQARCRTYIGSSSASVEILEQAREVSEKVGDDVSRFEVLRSLAFAYRLRGDDQQKSRRLLEELQGIAIQAADPELVAHAWCELAVASTFDGNFIAALEEFDRVSKLPVGTMPFEAINFWSTNSWVLWFLGYPERAQASNRKMLAIGREVTASLADLALALTLSAFFSLLLRDPKTAASHSDEAVRLGHEHGFLKGIPAVFNYGRALAQLGQIEEGLSEMLRWQTYMKTTGADTAYFTSVGVAEAYLAAGRPRDGLEALSEGLELVRRTGTRVFEAEMRRLRGELLLMGSNRAEIEAAQCFRDAIEVARRQSAKSLELRAAMSLARLLTEQGRRDEARMMLAEIYSWFTEGFDTADLKDAKILLAQLAG